MTNKEAKQTVEYLASLMKDAKNNRNPLPIVFLGAGASVSAGIPLTNIIVRHIKLKHKDNYAVKNLISQSNNNYYDVMGALTSEQRRDLFYYYITRDKVKINVTNIYLAQLLKEGYIDYILTVNFDDLILRACGLFNFLPPVYDISNVNLFTTSGYRAKSVTYLHGQYFGQWLLNKKEELRKVEEDVDRLFKQITIRRTWIIVGYSGQDRIFDHLVNLDSFSNELFWISYLDNDPAENVMNELINKSNSNANLIKGYGSDSFFLKLHAELKDIETPDIFNKPFSFLKEVVSKVKDVKDHKPSEENIDLYLEVDERMKITNRWIDHAILEIEEKDSVERFKQQIIDAYTKEEFEENEEMFIHKLKSKEFIEANEELANFYLIWATRKAQKAIKNNDKDELVKSFEKYESSVKLDPNNENTYNNWGNALRSLAEMLGEEDLYRESIEKYEKSTELNPDRDLVYNNWGNAVCGLAKQKKDESLYRESFEKYQKSIELNPENDSPYYNFGTALSDLAEQKKDESLYRESFEKYQKSIELNPNDFAYYNWGNALRNLAKMLGEEGLYRESFDKYLKSIELNSNNDMVYYNWGVALTELAMLKGDENLYQESIEKYTKSGELNPEDELLYNNWAATLANYSHLPNISKEKKNKLLFEAKEKAEIAYKKGGSPYNLSCTYVFLNEKEKALEYLELSLENNYINKEHILKDDDWIAYHEDEGFKALLEKY